MASARGQIGIRLHMLLLGIIICVVVYMYLVCRDVKRIEFELADVRADLFQLTEHVTSIVPAPSAPSAAPLAALAPAAPSAALAPVHLNSLSRQEGEGEEEGDDALSEDLRDMLTRIEDDDDVVSDVPPCLPIVDDVVPPCVAGERTGVVDVIVDVVDVVDVVDALDVPATRTIFTEGDLKSKKLEELKKLLRDQNMDASGKKDALVARLLQV